MYLTTVNMPAIRGSLAALTLLIAVGVGCQSQSTIGAAPEDAPKTDEEGVNTPGSSKTIPSTKEVALIPRSVLFGNPQRASARISPNGEWLSFLAPVDGILNVWVAPVDDLEAAKPITDDKVRDIRSHSWAYTGDRILYTQDKEGDENWHVYATNVETGETTDLTPIDGVNARIQGLSDRIPDAILVGLNDRDPRLHDVYRVDLETGERELVQQNPGVAGFVIDDDFDVRFAVNFTMDGGQVLLKSTAGEGGAKEWTEEFIKIGPEDAMTTGPAGFNKDGTVLYMLDSRDRNTGALFALDLETGEKKLVAKNDKADVGEVLAHPTKKTIEAVGFTYSRREWDILEDSIRADLDYLASVEDGELIVTSRTLDDSLWTVAYLLDDGPLKFYLYDRDNRNAKYLFSSRDDLDEYELVKMHTPVIPSRDGLDLVAYLSLPPGSDPDGDGVPDSPKPLVLDVHGGPWARDSWGYNPYHQWLANRGYAVLNVNYRGSTGFGKDFVNAANGEWAGKMHDDLVDAVNWAVDNKIADGDKVCIMGGSYGGYATLVGLTFTPELFACGVDIVGPSSLVTLLQNVPPYWAPFMPVMKVRVGDVDTEEGREELLKRSPLTLVDKIERPLLIGQGANDPRVTQLEADQIVKAMESRDIPVTYVLYPDEGHGFSLEENRMSFNAVTEAFLAEYLGGRMEPIGDDFEGASLHVPAGAEVVPGIKDALPEDRRQMPPEEKDADSAPVGTA